MAKGARRVISVEENESLGKKAREGDPGGMTRSPPPAGATPWSASRLKKPRAAGLYGVSHPRAGRERKREETPFARLARPG